MLLCAQAYYVTEPRFNRVAVAVWRFGGVGRGFLYSHLMGPCSFIFTESAENLDR